MPDKQNSWIVFDGKTAKEILLSPNFLRQPKRLLLRKLIDRIFSLDSVCQHVLNFDGDKHAKLRKIMLRVWKKNSSTTDLESLERKFLALYSQLPSGHNDLMTSVLVPYGLGTIIDVMGFEETDCKLKNLIDAPTKSNETLLGRIKAGINARKFIKELSRKMQENSFKAGISTDLVASYRAGEILREECLSSIILFIAAGTDTAVGMIANSVIAMNSEFLEKQKSKISVLEATASRSKNSALVFSLPRWAQHDVNVDNCKIKKGDRIQVCLLGSSEQLEFTFGFGPHYCLGAEIGKRQHNAALNFLLGQQKIRVDLHNVKHRLVGTLVHSPLRVPVFLD